MKHAFNDAAIRRLAGIRRGQMYIEEDQSASSSGVTSVKSVSLSFVLVYYSNGIAWVGGSSFGEGGGFIDPETGEVLEDQTMRNPLVKGAIDANTSEVGQTTSMSIPTSEDLDLVDKVLTSIGASGISPT